MRTISRFLPLLLAWCLVALAGRAADPAPAPAPAAAALATSNAVSAAIESWLDEKAAVWTQKPDEFMKLHEAQGFKWTDERKTLAQSGDGPLTFGGQPVPAVTAHFTNGLLQRLTLIYFDQERGDYLTTAEYEKLLTEVNQRAARWGGNAGVSRPVTTTIQGMNIKAWAWGKPPHQLELWWGFSPKTATGPRPEFVRLRLSRLALSKDALAAAGAGGAGAAGAVAGPKLPRPPQTVAELRTRVAHVATNGDVLIKGIPLVDQGPNGYCAAAVATRLLLYYGHPAEMTKLTEVAQADVITGSPPELLVKGLKAMAQDRKFELTKVIEFNAMDYEKMVKDYNRLTKRVKDKDKEDKELTWGENSSAMDFLGKAKPERLVEVRAKQFAEFDLFKRALVSTIEAGAPLTWVVALGVVKEKTPPPGAGGYVRLIVGYNNRTGEILYSDSLGAAHDLKRLPLADAWPMTIGLYVFHPPNLRF